MKVSDLMTGRTLTPDAEGIALADDMVFAIGFGDETEPNDFLVAQAGVTEHSGAITAQTQDSQYIRTGLVTTVTGKTKAFTLNGDRFRADPFQEALMAHAMKYGTGASVVKPFVYFDIVTGKGEKGTVSISVEGDVTNAAGANAGIAATMSSQGIPEEYTYAAATP